MKRALRVLFLLVLLGIGSLELGRYTAYRVYEPAAAGRRSFLSHLRAEPEAAISAKKVLRFSVIPGGVHTLAEMRHQFDVDPEYHALLEGFDWDHAYEMELSEPSCFFASFRKPGHSIRWTKMATVCLPAGEKVFTDGLITVREACGNRISIFAKFPVDASVPGTDLNKLGPPPDSPTMPPLLTASSVPASAPTTHGTPGIGGWFPGGFFVGPKGGDDSPSSPSSPGAPINGGKPVAMPEPSALALMIAALFGFAVVQGARRLVESGGVECEESGSQS